ncbi:MAG: FAD-dependent oxidoreductase [Candidatus Hydrogenedentes bacterium]|nr:FAD-dependent oxidoreductase [Candidatus Hydrogenedentota bacterium]
MHNSLKDKRMYRPLSIIGLPVIAVLISFSLPSLAKDSPSPTQSLLIEAESFDDIGGWVIDQQSMDQMGSPYLMAHGLGRPVNDATKQINIEVGGKYRLWIRTRDWVAPWKTAVTKAAMKAVGTPGKFQLLIDGVPVPTVFGTQGAEWAWQDGGVVTLKKGETHFALRDLTGFNGRCDAIILSTDQSFIPPNTVETLQPLRQQLLGITDTPHDGRKYDLVVVGGGIAGICTAISAARKGCRVALIQNRPVLGGNKSSEVRVGLSGLIREKPYTNLGNLVDEIDPVGHWALWDANKNPDAPRSKEVFQIIENSPGKKVHNAGPASNYDDNKKLQAVLAEKNISLFLNTHVNDVEMNGNTIVAVIGQDIRSGQTIRFEGSLFADCTGDGNLGFMAGADFRQGREANKETGESLAPEKEDQLVMGTSMQWNSIETDSLSAFPDCPWAVQFTAKTCVKTDRGDWDWETGTNYDQVDEIEIIRDYALRIIFGNWSVLKNDPLFKTEFEKRKLKWIAYIGGKRESRRLLGDVILKQQDIVEQKPFNDASVTTTWTIDLHYPKEPLCACDAFQSEAKHLKITPYPIPYRCLYSRNVDNLFMAGRNISVTHVALGTVRVQRTTGMMGEVVGFAAYLGKKHRCNPREVYERHLDELKQLMELGVLAS